jgi:hypothetical protein
MRTDENMDQPVALRRAAQGGRARKSIRRHGGVNYWGGAGTAGACCIGCAAGDAAVAGRGGCADRAGRRGGTGVGSAAAEVAFDAGGVCAAGAFVPPPGGAEPAADSELMILTGGIDDEDGNSYFDETGTPVGPPGGAAGSARENSATGPTRAVAQLGAYLATSA